jgi:hypothetical protein
MNSTEMHVDVLSGKINRLWTTSATVSPFDWPLYIGQRLLNLLPSPYPLPFFPLFVSYKKCWLDGNFNFVNEHVTSYPMGNHETTFCCQSSIFSCVVLKFHPSLHPLLLMVHVELPRWKQTVFAQRGAVCILCHQCIESREGGGGT